MAFSKTLSYKILEHIYNDYQKTRSESMSRYVYWGTAFEVEKFVREKKIKWKLAFFIFIIVSISPLFLLFL